MGNTYGAHIFKRAQVGEREEVTIKLFLPDGSPIDLTNLSPGGDPGDGGGEIPDGAMIFKGTWNSFNDYKKYDVVQYNPGDGVHTYIYNQDVDSGLPVIIGPNGVQISKFWDPLVNQMDLVLDANSPVGPGAHEPNAPWDAFAIRINQAGQLRLTSADTLSRSQDLYAYLYHQKPDLTWEIVAGDDDSAGANHPLISFQIPVQHAMPGIYAYYLGPLRTNPDYSPIYGTTRVTKMGDNTAVIGSFADFPANLTTRIG